MTALHARATYHEALSRLNDRHLLRDLSYVAGRWEWPAFRRPRL